MRTRYDIPAMLDERGLSTAAEIGIHHGYFSYYLLRHSKLRLLWSVDSWSGKWSDLQEDAAIYLSEFGERSRIVHATSASAAALAREERQAFDFIYVDAHHSYRSVAADIAAWSDLLNPGGILAGHDYIDTRGCGVIRAVEEYAERNFLRVQLTRERWATWLIDHPASSVKQGGDACASPAAFSANHG